MEELLSTQVAVLRAEVDNLKTGHDKLAEKIDKLAEKLNAFMLKTAVGTATLTVLVQEALRYVR